jgi:hypothetical protein
MILRIFKGTGPGVIFLISLTLILVWIGAFLYPHVDQASYSEKDLLPLYRILITILGESPFPGLLFSFFIASLMAFIIVNFNTTDFFINERTFLPAFFYVLLTGLFPQNQLLSPVVPASLFLMLAIIRINDTYRKAGTAYNFFDAGILISTGSLFYGNLIWFGLLIISGILIFRSVTIKEIVVSLIGLITPYIIAFGFYYLLGKDLQSLFIIIKNNLFGISDGFVFSRITLAVLIFVILLILISFVYLLFTMNIKKIKARKTFYLLIWVFLISVGIYVLLPSVSVEITWLMIIPVSYFLTHFFLYIKKKRVPGIIFSLLIVLILLLQALNLFDKAI